MRRLRSHNDALVDMDPDDIADILSRLTTQPYVTQEVIWGAGEPNWRAALALPDVKLHLYGKTEARSGRKMGHLNATAGTALAAEELVRRARSLL